jgi:hypothetical protein
MAKNTLSRHVRRLEGGMQSGNRRARNLNRTRNEPERYREIQGDRSHWYFSAREHNAIQVAHSGAILVAEDTMTLYHCPDCDRIHDEPFEAAFTLMARCVDCSLEHLTRETPHATPLAPAA